MRIDHSNEGLGPVLGQIAGWEIRANQTQRKNFTWGEGYGTPSDGMDTRLNRPAIRKITPDAKSLVIYWSRSGSTELLASYIAAATNSDILEIALAKPYPADYQATLKRANFEREHNQPPQLAMQLPDLTQYQQIFLGYQTWAMTLSQPMKAFLLAYGDQLNGKRIAPFLSQGSYGAGDSLQLIRTYLPSSQISSPLIVDGNRVDKARVQTEKWARQIISK